MFSSKEVLNNSNVTFGTSGARGLVNDFTAQVCASFAHSFIEVMKPIYKFDAVAIGIDNRPSSKTMAQAIAYAVSSLGLNPIYCGVLPTPALASYAAGLNIPSIMVTGSHIPFDRNGLKFYRPDGEITKNDELAINQADVRFSINESQLPSLTTDTKAAQKYIERYTSLFKEPILKGKKIGIYEHSSAGRDLYRDIFVKLGAEVVTLERSDEFVPIDTEAVSLDDQRRAEQWSKEFGFDAIFSTDGDGDRPLISDEFGNWIRGDVLGLVTAATANIEALAIPVSCNTAVEMSGLFKQVIRTKIGSPYVIAEFDKLNKKYKTVAGFEANGGFLLGSDIEVNGNSLSALPTRDAVLPAIMLFIASKKLPISECIKKLPKRFTYSDRIKNFPLTKTNLIFEKYINKLDEFLKLLCIKDQLVGKDTKDGLRLSLYSGNIIHIRASGNAPELRCYAESHTEIEAKALVKKVLTNIQGIVKE